MNAEQIKNLIETTKGRFFSVEFVKKDGTLRKMICRTGVKTWKDSDGNIQAVNGNGKPKPENLKAVFGIKEKGYRSFYYESVKSLKINGITYNF